jgi:hypothetical protein
MTPIWCRLSDETEEALSHLPDTFGRAVGALHFLQYMGSHAGKPVLHIAYLRASLAEYAGMEDAFKSDLRAAGVADGHLRITDTGNTMLILTKELRNLQIHLVSREFRTWQRPYAMEPGGEPAGETTVHVIPRSDLDAMAKLENAKYYDPAELSAAIQWFDEAQCHWGITDVLLASIEGYAAAIVRHVQRLRPQLLVETPRTAGIWVG